MQAMGAQVGRFLQGLTTMQAKGAWLQCKSSLHCCKARWIVRLLLGKPPLLLLGKQPLLLLGKVLIKPLQLLHPHVMLPHVMLPPSLGLLPPPQTSCNSHTSSIQQHHQSQAGVH